MTVTSLNVDLGVLALIPQIAKDIEALKKEHEKLKQYMAPPVYDLTKRSGVMEYLNISSSTIARYLSEGVLIEGYHFYRDIKGGKTKITFVSGAIEEFKKSKDKKWDSTIEMEYSTSQ